MYAITEVAGKVSGELVATGQPVRAVVRDATQTEAWAERGCEIATDFIEDPSSLAAAFEGSTSVFILPP